ncbi:MAG TPA: phosphoribosyltransferase family protein [Tepidisphaeraceae bacterium]|nr:phosphoribosyltransferase family protein [Tepidisphaeraceae bacterium]
MTHYLDLIDRTTTGNRCDVTPLFADPEAFAQMLDDLLGRIGDLEFDLVVAVDALGFILGTGMAMRMGKGLVVARKGGKLPLACNPVTFVDYTGQTKGLEMRKDALRRGERVLIVDEWVETGAQICAVISLVEGLGGVVAGVASLNIDEGAELVLQGYSCFHLHAGA